MYWYKVHLTPPQRGAEPRRPTRNRVDAQPYRPANCRVTRQPQQRRQRLVCVLKRLCGICMYLAMAPLMWHELPHTQTDTRSLSLTLLATATSDSRRLLCPLPVLV